MTAHTSTPCQIYLITPPEIADMNHFITDLEAVLQAAPIACLQIRLKNIDDLALIQAADRIVPLCHHYGASVIINDRPDIVEACRADGVHIGQEDMDYFSSRELLGEDAIIGVTCHNSKDLAFQAAYAGANYVAFGAFFETPTKVVKARANTEILQWWHEAVEIPCVAIGGINPDNAKTLIAAGADFIATCSGVWKWPEGSVTAVKKLHALCLDHAC